MSTVIVIDLNSLGVPIWMTSSSDADPDAASIRIVERVRALTSGVDHAVIALDVPPYFRKDISADYKANRPPAEAPMRFQINKAAETLRADGYPVFGVRGFEADDLAATIAYRVLMTRKDDSVLVVSSDKDLLALVCDRVQVKSVKTGDVFDDAGVVAKFGVPPSKMVDFLSLCGDASDGIKGADKVGPKTAASLLDEFGDLDAMFKAFDAGATPTMTPNLRGRLQEFRARRFMVRQLVTLRTDVPLPDFDEIFKPRVPTGDDVAVFGDEPFGTMIDELIAGELAQHDAAFGVDMQNKPTPAQVAESREAAESLFANNRADVEADIAAAMPDAPKPSPIEVLEQYSIKLSKDEQPKETPNAARSANAANSADEGRPMERVHEVVGSASRERADGPRADDSARSQEPLVRHHGPDRGDAGSRPNQDIAKAGQQRSENSTSLTPVVVDYERSLEPKSLSEAVTLAKHLFDSRLFSAWGSGPAVLSILLSGRELGMGAMASLRAFDNIQGKPTMKADLIRALVMRSGKAQYLRCTERTAARATFVTHRHGDPEPVTLSYSIEDAKLAGLIKSGSGWERNPHDMLVARAGAKLCRLVYPDICHGLIGSEEMDQ